MQEAQPLRGVAHLHTVFSHDGALTPSRIADMCAARGLSFAAISDHAEDMDEGSMAELVRQCKACSGPGFALIPGLEHRLVDGVHMLALGQRRLLEGCGGMDLQEWLAREGCVLVLAHCNDCGKVLGDMVRSIHALEVWNVAHDTRYFPTSGGAHAYRCCTGLNPGLLALGGLDMHTGREWGCELVLDGRCPVRPQDILRKVCRGEFTNRGRFVSFSSRPGFRGVNSILSKAGDTLVRVRDIRDLALATLGVK